MTCRCSSPAEHAARAQQAAYESNQRAEERRQASTPNPAQYEVVRAEAVGPHLVMQVKYPNCTLCEFEGTKIMVFLHTTAMDALKWKRIDPHFRRDEERSNLARVGWRVQSTSAPSPAARFPGNEQGWADAVDYAKVKA